MNVMAEFSLVPIGVGVSVSRYVALCHDVLEERGLDHEAILLEAQDLGREPPEEVGQRHRRRQDGTRIGHSGPTTA